jgi:hypothetical protein
MNKDSHMHTQNLALEVEKLILSGLTFILALSCGLNGQHDDLF